MGFLQISKNSIYLFRKSKHFFPYDFALARLARMQKDYVSFLCPLTYFSLAIHLLAIHRRNVAADLLTFAPFLLLSLRLFLSMWFLLWLTSYLLRSVSFPTGKIHAAPPDPQLILARWTLGLKRNLTINS